MPIDLEQKWLNKKAVVSARINDLLDAGISLETARYLAGWNPTLDYANYSDVSSQEPIVPTPVPVEVRNALRLLVSRSPSRVNDTNLNGDVLDAGKLYAIFLPDVPELGITSIGFSLNGSPIHFEYSAPWDYAGTELDGSANRVSFAAGDYIITANITDTSGSYGIEASFTVE